MCLVGLLYCPAEVHHGEKRKNKGLYEYDEHSEDRREGKERIGYGHHYEEDVQNLLVSHHVAEKTERQGHGPCQMAYDFNRHHEHEQPPRGAYEVFVILEPVLLYAYDMRGAETGNRKPGRNIYVRGGRQEPREKPYGVGGEYV